jgi:nicotinate-nucleotide pyrophosphorylase (carboxylating)
MSLDFKGSETLQFIQSSLEEDVKDGDHSSLASIPQGTQGKAKLIFKENGIAAGLELAKSVLEHVDSNIQIDFKLRDGDPVRVGDIGFYVQGSVHSILVAERLLLNCMQRLSGIATTTRVVVDMVAHTNTTILDTRKTTPGLRFLEKWAVTVGGGANHRIGLYDMIMLKDNHNDYAGGITQAVTATHAYLKQKNLDLKIEVETRNLDEVKDALAVGGVDRIMLDNFEPSEIVEALKIIDGSCETEASGGINMSNVVSYAETGVDFISMGALTHSVKSLDISLKEY